MPMPNFLDNLTSSSKLWSWLCGSSRSNEIPCVSLTLALIILAISWSLWMFIKKRGAAPEPPGPVGLPLLGHLPFLKPELHSYFTNLARVHGPIIQLRFGNKVGVVVSSPNLAHEVLKVHDSTFANRDVPQSAIEAMYGGCDIAWTHHGPEWRMLRKVSALGMLGSAKLDNVYDLRRREIRQTVNYLYSQAGLPVNVGEQMFLTVLNVITSMMWGGTMKGEERASLGAEFREIVAEMTQLLGKPNISDFYSGLAWLDLQGIKKQMKRLAQRFDGIFNSIIEQRLKIEKEDGNANKEGNDFLQFLLNVKDEADSKTPLTMNHLKALLMDMVVGGTDTTSNTIEYAMAELMNKPEAMRKVVQELEAVVGIENMVEESHIHKLSYLRAVIKETLRLHPALPLLVPHCPNKSCIVGGYNIPKGARVFVNVWAIHRDPLIWNKPLEFDPERFLCAAWDYTSGNDFNYFPFGSGRRICAGVALAERMTVFSLATLLHSFEWKLAREELDLSEKFGIVLKKKIPLVAIPTPKSTDPAFYE